MEKIQEDIGGNAEVKNIYFGFENFFPTKAKNNSEILPKKRKKSKKSKSKTKKENANMNEFNQIKTIKNSDFDINNNYSIKGSKYAKKPLKVVKTDEEKEKEYLEEKAKKKKRSKKKSKSKSKSKIKKQAEDENYVETEESKKKSKTKSKEKNKKKSKSKSKEKKSKNKEKKSKSKEKKSKTKKKQKSKNKEETKKENKTVDLNKNKTINNYEENIEIPEYNEIKDEAMNDVNKHIHNLNLDFNNNINNLKKTSNKITKGKNNQFNKSNIINNNNNNIINSNYEDETMYKRPYTAHGYKVKAKSKRMTKTMRPNNLDEEEKIIAFKEKVLVYDKILSLYNAPKIKKDNNNIEDNLSKTHQPRIGSAFNLNKTKNNSSKHYMKPREKDIKKIKKKEILYSNDKPEEDFNEKYIKEENEIKNKNNKVIKIINSSKKVYNKSKEVLSDLKDILTKDKMDAFMTNFMLKNNFNLEELKKVEESKINNKYKNIKFYHGGKDYNKPKPRIKLMHNNSDNNLEKNKRYKIFNPKEIISNPNNKFNFFSQTFTKQPIYGKYYNPPEVESQINNNLSYIENNKWNGRYTIKKYVNEEKENPNDVYNYDYKYDDLNSDSDNELPSTNFKAKTIPKYNKVDIEYKDNKTGKIVGGKYKLKIENEKYQDNGKLDKYIYHPFLIDENMLIT